MPHVLDAGEDHAGHPEENDVVARHQGGGGIEILQILGVVRPAQGGEGPQGGGEPGVQHVFILGKGLAAALGADGGVFPAHDGVSAVLAVPGGDAVAPPELAADAPVFGVFHPVVIDFGEPVGQEIGFPVLHRFQGGFR